MSTEETKVQTKIRTYAKDLEIVKAQRDGGGATDVPLKDAKEQSEKKPERPKTPITSVDTEEVQMAQAATDVHRPEGKTAEEIEEAANESLKSDSEEIVEETPISEPTPKVAPPKKIPAYHEIQKQAAKMSKAEADGNGRQNIGYDATVIRDTKKHSFSLFPSIGKSLAGWWKGLRKSFKKKKPEYVVSDSSHRKGVIQKATSKSGTMFTTDNDNLREKIRQRHLAEEERDEAEMLWSPYTETGYELLDAPDTNTPDSTSNVQVEAKRSALVKPVPAPEPIEEVKQKITAPEPTPEPVNEPEPVPEPEPEPFEEAKEEVVEPEPTPEPEPVIEPEPVPEELPSEQIEDDSDTVFTDGDFIPDEEPEPEEFNVRDTNTLTLMLLGGVLLIVGLAIIIRLFVWSPETLAPEPRSIPADTSLSGAQTSEVVYSGETSLFTALQEFSATQPMGLIDVQIIDTNGMVIPAESVFDTLNFDMITSFRQSITDVRFATMNQSEPLLVFTFTDTNTVRGGFLEWEQTMASDMAPLYNLDVNSSTAFTDEVIRGIDVRIMRTNEGEPILMYGIVNDNVALIAHDIDSFTQVIQTSFEE